MSAAVMPTKVAAFVRERWSSASHRKMFYLGQVVTKVAALFQFTASDPVPHEATLVFVLLLEGMESGNADEYTRCEASAMALYREWLAGRAVN